MRCVAWTDTSHIHKVRTTTTTPPPTHTHHHLHHLRSHFGSRRYRCAGVAFLGPVDLSALSSAFTSLSLHSDCSVAAMISPPLSVGLRLPSIGAGYALGKSAKFGLSAGLWLPSIGAGNALGKSAKFEDLRVPEVLVALVGSPPSNDDTVSPRRDPSPYFVLEMLTCGFGAVSGTNLSIFFLMVFLAATLVPMLFEAHCDFVVGKCASCAMMGLVTLLFLADLCHEWLHLFSVAAGKGYVHKEDGKVSVNALFLVISLLTTSLSTIAGGTAAARCAVLRDFLHGCSSCMRQCAWLVGNPELCDHSSSCVLLAPHIRWRSLRCSCGVQGSLVRDNSGSCVLLAPHICVRSQRFFCFWLCFLEHW